jgi:hypothetical protein
VSLRAFDGWVLKPISLVRMSELLAAIADAERRRGALYVPGNWDVAIGRGSMEGRGEVRGECGGCRVGHVQASLTEVPSSLFAADLE